MQTKAMGVRAIGLLLALSAVSCGGSRGGDDVGAVGHTDQALIQDESHNGGPAGFEWLPPMVAGIAPASGPFNASANPVVTVDRLGTNDALTRVTTLSGSSVRTIQRCPDLSFTGLPCPFYGAIWLATQTKSGETYRVRTWDGANGTQLLGTADVQVVGTALALLKVDRTKYVPLLEHLPLLIPFRISTVAAPPPPPPPADADGDGVPDATDNCPHTPNPTQTDTNHDGKGDACQCDGVTCAAPGACHAAGVCDPTSGVCSNPNAPDGTACDDGNACTKTDACAAGVCSGGSPVTCTATDACHAAGACDPTSGVCSNPAAPDGTTCIDGNACTQADACVAGACTGANPVTCAAPDTCHTAGACDPATGVCAGSAAIAGCSIDVCALDAPCGGGSTCTDTSDGGHTCQCEQNYSSPDGTNCTSTKPTLQIALFYDESIQRLWPENAESHLSDMFESAKSIFDSNTGLNLTLALEAQVFIGDAVPARACNTTDPTSQSGCTGCWGSGVVPLDCGGVISTDPFEVDPKGMLSSFGTLVTARRTALVAAAGPFDVAFLATARVFSGGEAGLTFESEACSTLNVGVVSVAIPTDFLGVNLAHQIGHGIGMQHDLSGRYVMSPALFTPPATVFSPASEAAFATWAQSPADAACIANTATSHWTTVTCGNGVVEAGEACDSGEAADSCCTSTCTLAPGCDCANTEPCCQNGEPKPAGTACGAAADGACDVANTCDGASPECNEVDAPAGTPCSVSQDQFASLPPTVTDGRCLRGTCVSRDIQCTTINEGMTSDPLACESSTACNQLDCGTAAEQCAISWLVPADDGSSCGPSSQCSAGACVPSASLLAYHWSRDGWGPCTGGTQTRGAECRDDTGAVVTADKCSFERAPLVTRACTP